MTTERPVGEQVASESSASLAGLSNAALVASFMRDVPPPDDPLIAPFGSDPFEIPPEVVMTPREAVQSLLEPTPGQRAEDNPIWPAVLEYFRRALTAWGIEGEIR